MSEKVEFVEPGKTKGLLSFHCMTKEFRNCFVSLAAYDPKGKKVLVEKDHELATYKIEFTTPGEYKFSFYNREVVQSKTRKWRNTSQLDWSATTAERSFKIPRPSS